FRSSGIAAQRNLESSGNRFADLHHAGSGFDAAHADRFHIYRRGRAACRGSDTHTVTSGFNARDGEHSGGRSATSEPGETIDFARKTNTVSVCISAIQSDPARYCGAAAKVKIDSFDVGT